MARPTARVLALLELLQAGGTRTVAELAARLEVDGRTLRRYVEHLRDMEIPVEGVRGRYGGYRLARHYRMPPLMLTDEEALAVVWALLFDRRSQAGPASSPAMESAMAKVRRVLPDTLARRIDAVLQTVDFTGDPSPAGPQETSAGRPGRRNAKTLLDLAEAARDRHLVVFDYRTHHGRVAQRQVQPHGVVAHRGVLYLTGFDVDRQAPRTFRLERMTGLQVRPVTFAAPTESDPIAQVVGALSAAPGRHEVSVLVNADLAYVQTRIPDTLASVTPVSDVEEGGAWLRVFLRAERLEWVAGTLAALDRPFVIEQPPALHDVVHDLGRRLMENSARRNPYS
jgi:predicted DNA-binding transcriptional regulator YafY